MKSEFLPTFPADQQQIIDLSVAAFGVPPDAPFLNPALLHWKYWHPRQDFADPRSYGIKRDQKLVAHTALWPLNIEGESGIHMIDWAGHPQAPGAGVTLLQKLTQMSPFICGIGGSESTMAVLPRFGFKTVGEAATWARPIRPIRQILCHPYRDSRLPARALRNFWWSALPPKVSHQGWSAELTGAGSDLGKGKGFFNYLKACPVANVLGFQIHRPSGADGFFSLCVVQRQARVAEIILPHASPADWRIALELTQQAALQHTDACEIMIRSLAGTPRAAATAEAGFKLRKRLPVFVWRKRGNPEDLRLSYEACDNDEVFLAGTKPDFLT